MRVSTRRQGRSAGLLLVSAQMPDGTRSLLFSYLHPSYPDCISHAPLRVTDQVEANQISSSTPLSTTLLARLGPHITTLQLSRRSAAQPLGNIDYNADILTPVLSCQRLAMTSQPCLLTPAQAALAHALPWHGSGASACVAFVAAVLVCWHVSLVAALVHMTGTAEDILSAVCMLY